MLYHDDCLETDDRDFGQTLVCLLHFGESGEYQCPACFMVFQIADQEELPEGVSTKMTKQNVMTVNGKRILDARQPGAMVKDIRQGDYIIYSHAVYQIRGDGRHTQSHLISNDPEQWLESVRLEEWDYDMMTASFLAGTGRG